MRLLAFPAATLRVSVTVEATPTAGCAASGAAVNASSACRAILPAACVRRNIRRSLVVLALLTAPAAAASGPFEVYGPSIRARALGNATVATPDAASAHSNPALLAHGTTSFIVHAGYALDVPVTSVSSERATPENSPLSAAPLTPVSGVLVGFGLPADVLLKETFFVGATAYFPTQVLIRARAHDPQRPFFYLYDSATEHFEISVAAGVKLIDWLSAGAGARVGAGQKGSVSLQLDPVRGRLTNQAVDAAQYPTASPTAGVLIGPVTLGAAATSIGLSYKEKTSFDVTLPTALVIDGAEIDVAADVLVVANFQPRTIAAGASLTLAEELTLNAEAHYAFWSEAPPPMLSARVDLGGAGLEALGLEEALDAPARGQERVVVPGFVDTLNVRVGGEWRLLGPSLALRAGYQYRPTPVPEQTTGTNIIDNDAHVVASGFALTARLPWFARPVHIEGAYQVHILEPRSARKVNPNDAVGDWTASGAVHSLAVGLGYSL